MRPGSNAPRVRLLDPLIGGIFLAPMLVLGMAGYWMWRVDIDQAATQTLKGAQIVGERVEHALETQVLALEWVLDRARGMGWEEIQNSRELHELLHDVDRRYDASSEIYLIDATGAPRSDSTRFPIVNEPGNGPFRPIGPVAPGDAALVGAPSEGMLVRERSFPIARARPGFDGFAVIALRIAYFTEILKSAALGRFTMIQLHQSDGTLLARFPEQGAAPRHSPSFWITSARTEAPYPLAAPLLADEQGGHIAGVFRLRRYPLMLTYSIDRSLLFGAWLSEFVVYGLVALISSLALSALAVYSLRRARGERAAMAAWNAEITQRLAAEQTATQLKKFEALGTLSGGIVHYFNNLLPALVGHLEIARLESETGASASTRMQRLIIALNDAREFLRGISTFSGRNVASFAPVCLSTLVRGCLETIAPLFAANVRVESSIDPDIWVHGDERQLNDLVMNLLRNAIEAIGDRPGLIEIDLAASTHAHANGQCKLECRDTGRGMSPEVAERAFDPFFTTKPGPGGGLGLSICAGIVNAHASRIEVNTAPGKGTRMTVVMPTISRQARSNV